MPTIEITAAQAKALAAGENVTIAPQQHRYIVAISNGNTFECLSSEEHRVGFYESGSPIKVRGECKLIAKGPHSGEPGHIQNAVAPQHWQSAFVSRAR